MGARSLKDIFQSVSHSHQFIIWLADHFPSPANAETQTRQNQIALMITYKKYMEYKFREAKEHHLDKQKIEQFDESTKQQQKEKHQQLMDHLSIEQRKREADRIEQMLKRIDELRKNCQRFIEEQTKKVIDLYGNHEYTGDTEKTYGFKDGDGKIINCIVPLKELHDYVKTEMTKPDENNQSRLEKSLQAEDPIAAIQASELELVKEFLCDHVLVPAIEARDGLVAGIESIAEDMFRASASVVKGIAQTISAVLSPVVEAEVAKALTLRDQLENLSGINTCALKARDINDTAMDSKLESIITNTDSLTKDDDMIEAMLGQITNSQDALVNNDHPSKNENETSLAR